MLCTWDFPGKNTGVGSDAFLQGIFLTQGSNLGLMWCRQILYLPSCQGGNKKRYSVSSLSIWFFAVVNEPGKRGRGRQQRSMRIVWEGQEILTQAPRLE